MYYYANVWMCLDIFDILEARVKFHVYGEFAVLAPVRGPGVWASLNYILRKSSLEEGAGGIYLHIGTSTWGNRILEVRYR